MKIKNFILGILSIQAFSASVAQNVVYVNKTDGSVDYFVADSVKQIYFEPYSASSSGTIDGYAYIDMGTSVKWAICNVGASDATENGDYFAWSETTPKDSYCWASFKYGDESGITKYVINSAIGTVDNLSTLLPEDDAATANWGSNWRTPTDEEMKELRDSCTWERVYNFRGTKASGVVGTSKVNGNTIFFPYAGYYECDGLYSDCWYWTSTVTYLNQGAEGLRWNTDDMTSNANSRACGMPVRAVSDK